jgi:hypothetical protein
MNKNPTLTQRREKIQALAIPFLIRGTPLTREKTLPPIVVALEKYLVDQANRPGLKQPRNQIELRPFHIHFHHHKSPSLTPCSSATLQNQTPQSHSPHPHPVRWGAPQFFFFFVFFFYKKKFN